LENRFKQGLQMGARTFNASRQLTKSLVLLTISFALLPTWPAIAAESLGLKAPLHGLGAMGNPSFHHRRNNGIPDNIGDIAALPPGVFDVAVVNITWAQLQPNPGTLDTGPIDRTLDAVRDYNARHAAAPLALRLRVWAGTDAPPWAKAIGGAPISVQQWNDVATIGRFWTAPYRQAWQKLQAALASRYDSEPLIRETTVTSCTSISSEPFILPTDPSSIESLHAAGFSDAAYQNCLKSAEQDYQPWTTTRLEYPMNPFRGTDTGQMVVNWDFSIGLMQEWRQRLGARGVVSNYDLKSPLGPRVVPIYEAMKKLGRPMELQMFAPRNLDVNASVAYGISLGADVIELWNVVIPTIPPGTLQQWSRELKAN
jgi:hypothetical protein